jgi:hypothetical protein
MAYQPVDIGTVANDGTGDPIRDAFGKVNDNFVELYAGLVGLLDFKGSTDCSANPNYPAALKGDFYLVSVAGKIGGASGIDVEAGDTFFAIADNAGGTQAGVGTSWTVIQGNVTAYITALTGDVTASGSGSVAATIANNAVTFAKMVAAASQGVVWAAAAGNYSHNASGGGSTNFLRADGTWAAPPGTGGSFTAASTTEVLTGTDSAKGGTPDSIAALWEQGADVASAGTTSLGEGGYFHVTGTTTITDIDFATDKAGRKAWVEFTGILTLTHNASTLILPTGANITTAAGDTACFVSEGSDVVRCVAYNRASGAALTGGSSGALTLISEVVTSGSQASVNFTSIATTWRDLEIHIRGRGTASASNVIVRAQFNGDTAANYDTEDAHWFGTGTSFAQTIATTSLILGYIAAATAPSGYAGTIRALIGDYRGTTFNKQTESTNGATLGTGAGSVGGGVFSGNWRSTAAINAILIIISSGNFVDGSVVSLYGRM